jgi:hypothetical protein
LNEDVNRFVADQSAVFGPLVGDYAAAQAVIAENVAAERRRLAEAEGFAGLDLDYRLPPPPPGSVPEEPITRPRRRRGLFRWGRRH